MAIINLNLKEGRVVVTSVNSAFNGSDGILVQVIANFELESTNYAFSEAFCLARQAKGWYVRSSIFKWHDKIPPHVNDETLEKSDSHVALNGHASDVAVNGHPETPKPATPQKKTDSPKTTSAKTNSQKSAQPQAAPNAAEADVPISSPQTKPDVTDNKTSQPTPNSWAACVGNSNIKANNGNATANVETTEKVNGDTVAPQVQESKPVNGEATQNDAPKKQFRGGRTQHTIHISDVLKPGKTASDSEVSSDLAQALKGKSFFCGSCNLVLLQNLERLLKLESPDGV